MVIIWKNWRKIIKENLVIFLALLGSTLAFFRLVLSSLRILLPYYNHIWYFLTIIFNTLNILVAFLIIKYNCFVIHKNIQEKKKKKEKID